MRQHFRHASASQPATHDRKTVERTPALAAQLVFRGELEYVFTHGENGDFVTVTLSTVAIRLFHRSRLTADNLAKQAAEWALLLKPGRKMVDFSHGTSDLSEFSRYYFANQGGR
jgi:hypothetical protein